jgi:hypothetical protein
MFKAAFPTENSARLDNSEIVKYCKLNAGLTTNLLLPNQAAQISNAGVPGSELSRGKNADSDKIILDGQKVAYNDTELVTKLKNAYTAKKQREEDDRKTREKNAAISSAKTEIEGLMKKTSDNKPAITDDQIKTQANISTD